MMQDHSVDFMVRFWVVDNQVESFDVWVHELFPMDAKRRPGQDWISEHLENLSVDDLRELLGFTGNDVQILAKGTLLGRWRGCDPEWDEEVSFTDIQRATIPEGWFDGPVGRLPDVADTDDSTGRQNSPDERQCVPTTQAVSAAMPLPGDAERNAAAFRWMPLPT